MKKKLILTIAIALLGLTPLFSQTVNDMPIKDIDVEYVQIIGTSKMVGNKVTIEIDFGQENKLFVAKDTQIKDENGKLMTFNSMIDALNFMSKNGYDFETAYVVTITNQNIYYYLLKRRKE